jgi:hypothetical protein
MAGNTTTMAMTIRKKCYNMMKERMAPYGFTHCNYQGNQYCKVAQGGWFGYKVMAKLLP